VRLKALILLLLLAPALSWAACTGSSPSWTCSTWSDFKSCIESGHSECSGFQDGDTVTLAAGSYTATSTITITDPVVVSGGGVFGITYVTDQNEDGTWPTLTAAPVEDGTWPVTVTDSSNTVAFRIQASDGDEIHIRGFKFTGTWSTDHYIGGVINIYYTNEASKWIIHDNYANAEGRYIAGARASRGGLIYYNYVEDAGTGTMGISIKETEGISPGSGGYCATRMMDTPNFGGSNWTFIEDNVWNSSTAQVGSSAVDFSYGARVVMRYNYFWNNFISVHNITHDNVRGCLAGEFYGNTVKDSNTSPSVGVSSAYGIRSGTHLIHDNTIDGIQYLTTIFQERKDADSTWLDCDPGVNPWDGTDWCLDQPGRAKASGNTFTFGGSPASTIQDQASYPIYIWDLTLLNSTGALSDSHPYTTVDEDYFYCNSNCTEGDDYPSGYTPYTYPHPWRGVAHSSQGVGGTVGWN
jgi:hypothetical protein